MCYHFIEADSELLDQRLRRERGGPEPLRDFVSCEISRENRRYLVARDQALRKLGSRIVSSWRSCAPDEEEFRIQAVWI